MCDYSQKLQHLPRRAAKVGARLELVRFGHVTAFRPLGSKRQEVTCLKWGTEIAFERAPFFPGVLTWVECDNGERVQVTQRASSCEARLIQAPKPLDMARHTEDVLEFAGGELIAITCLPAGEIATVLQLPVGKRKRSKTSVPSVGQHLQAPINNDLEDAE